MFPVLEVHILYSIEVRYKIRLSILKGAKTSYSGLSADHSSLGFLPLFTSFLLLPQFISLYWFHFLFSFIALSCRIHNLITVNFHLTAHRKLYDYRAVAKATPFSHRNLYHHVL